MNPDDYNLPLLRIALDASVKLDVFSSARVFQANRIALDVLRKILDREEIVILHGNSNVH